MSEFTASPKNIFSGTSKLSSTGCLVYQAPENGGAIINVMLLFNTSSQDQLVQIYYRASSDGSAVTTNEQIWEDTIPAKRTLIIKGPIVLNAEYRLGFKSTSDDLFNVFLFGAELEPI